MCYKKAAHGKMEVEEYSTQREQRVQKSKF